jgi:glycosyltransferase involved in cell wall biosynthesis
VPAYNEEPLLGHTLSALTSAGKALLEPFEIVVADDASTDRTVEIAKEHGCRVVTVNHRQIAATRNAGANAATGEFLIFVDADTLVTDEVVRGAVAAMRNGSVGGGCHIRFDGRLPFYARFLLVALIPLYRLLGLAAGCFIFCTREAFLAVGGFDESMFGGEEVAMSRSLGRQGRFVIIREYVTTSGRKMRTYSAREILGTLMKLAIKGPKSVRQREGLDIWYGDRRPDPENPHEPKQ